MDKVASEDPLTGWPVEPKHPCNKGLAVSPGLCHLRQGGEPMVCGYEAGGCPFYGRYPDAGNQ